MIPQNFFSERLERVDMHNVLNRAIEVNEDIISDQNTNQLDKGLDSVGNDLGEYANYEYKNRWKPIDLKLTGDFRKSIAPKTAAEEFAMSASDWKTDKLVTAFGSAILGLSDEGVQTTGEFIKDDVQQLFAEEVLK